MTLISDRRPRHELPVGDVEVLFPEAKQRERRRRLRVAGAAILAGTLVAAAASYAATRGGGGGPRATIGPPSRSRPEHPAAGARAWPVSPVGNLRLADVPVALARSPYAYAVTVASTSPTSTNGRLARLDVATGQVTEGPAISSASELTSLGSTLAVLSPASRRPDGAPVGPWSLRLVEGRSTSLGHVAVLTFLGSPLSVPTASDPAIGAHDLWLGSGDSLYLVNASTGVLVRTVTLGAPVSSISIDPGGRRLYVALNELTGPVPAGTKVTVTTVVDELDPSTGRLLARRGVDFTTGPAQVDAVPGGVWLSYRGGMLGTVLLLRADGLKAVRPPAGTVKAGGQIPTMGAEMGMGIWTAWAEPTFWLEGVFGTSCVDPSSGTVRAGTVYPTRDGVQAWYLIFAQWNGRVYATGPVANNGTTAIVGVTPPAACGLAALARR